MLRLLVSSVRETCAWHGWSHSFWTGVRIDGALKLKVKIAILSAGEIFRVDEPEWLTVRSPSEGEECEPRIA